MQFLALMKKLGQNLEYMKLVHFENAWMDVENQARFILGKQDKVIVNVKLIEL